MSDQAPEFMKDWYERHSKYEMPSGMFTGNPENFVGAAAAVRAVIYFRDAHTPEVREAITESFEDYEKLAGPHLRWLWREDPPAKTGGEMQQYAKAKPMRQLMKSLAPNDYLSYHYHSGEENYAIGQWEAYAFGKRQWEAQMPDVYSQLDVFSFSMPQDEVDKHPTVFIKLFVDCCRRLKAVHGYAGMAIITSMQRAYDNQPTESYLHLETGLSAIDVGGGRPYGGIGDRFKGVNWLTALDNELIKIVNEHQNTPALLPPNYYAFYSYGYGVVVQAGLLPEGGSPDQPKPAVYVLPNHAFKSARIDKIDLLQTPYHSEDYVFMNGYYANQWLKRFDIKDDELMEYQRRLLDEQKPLTPAGTLPDRIEWPDGSGVTKAR